jgi:hypothetical protein
MSAVWGFNLPEAVLDVFSDPARIPESSAACAIDAVTQQQKTMYAIKTFLMADDRVYA